MPAHLWKDFLDKYSVYEFSVNAWCLYFFQERSVSKKNVKNERNQNVYWYHSCAIYSQCYSCNGSSELLHWVCRDVKRFHKAHALSCWRK